MHAWGAAHPALAVFLGRDLIWVMAGIAAVFVIAHARPPLTPPYKGGEREAGKIQKTRTVQILGSVSAAYLVKLLIGLIRFRNRPFISLPEVQPLIGNPITIHAFPSGHATIAFALATAIFFIDKRWGTGMLLLAAIVSAGRVLVGVHFPIDVLSGAILGSATAIVFHVLQRQIINRKS